MLLAEPHTPFSASRRYNSFFPPCLLYFHFHLFRNLLSTCLFSIQVSFFAARLKLSTPMQQNIYFLLRISLFLLLAYSGCSAQFIDCTGNQRCVDFGPSVIENCIIEVTDTQPIPNSVVYNASTPKHIACVSLAKTGFGLAELILTAKDDLPAGDPGVCLFLQGNIPAVVISGAVIKDRLMTMFAYGCGRCGISPYQTIKIGIRWGHLSATMCHILRVTASTMSPYRL